MKTHDLRCPHCQVEVIRLPVLDKVILHKSEHKNTVGILVRRIIWESFNPFERDPKRKEMLIRCRTCNKTWILSNIEVPKEELI